MLRELAEALEVFAVSRPMILVLEDLQWSDRATIQLAVQSGVTAYVVDGMAPDRIRPILEVAMMRFQEYQKLRDELELTKLQLNERKHIDKAKGLLMKRKGLSEEQAYALLRRMAMDRHMKIAELARSIVAAAELLG